VLQHVHIGCSEYVTSPVGRNAAKSEDDYTYSCKQSQHVQTRDFMMGTYTMCHWVHWNTINTHVGKCGAQSLVYGQ
jgi:hypothetical protein